jgi:hypothetical protein
MEPIKSIVERIWLFFSFDLPYDVKLEIWTYFTISVIHERIQYCLAHDWKWIGPFHDGSWTLIPWGKSIGMGHQRRNQYFYHQMNLEITLNSLFWDDSELDQNSPSPQVVKVGIDPIFSLLWIGFPLVSAAVAMIYQYTSRNKLLQ